MKTDVIFYMEETESAPKVVAFFLNEDYTNMPGSLRLCYSHIGQHSACHTEYADTLKQATKKQYSDLESELISEGYELNILNK